jgi:alkylation response protein AidB-like acyl-CoA dehydrogenase
MQVLEQEGLLARIPGLGYYVTRNLVVDKEHGRPTSVGIGSEQSSPVPGFWPNTTMYTTGACSSRFTQTLAGYIHEDTMGRAWADSRVLSIFGGTSEIMKTIIARDITGLRA